MGDIFKASKIKHTFICDFVDYWNSNPKGVKEIINNMGVYNVQMRDHIYDLHKIYEEVIEKKTKLISTTFMVGRREKIDGSVKFIATVSIDSTAKSLEGEIIKFSKPCIGELNIVMQSVFDRFIDVLNYEEEFEDTNHLLNYFNVAEEYGYQYQKIASMGLGGKPPTLFSKK